MRAVVVDEPGSVGLERVPDPTPGSGEVVVAVGACGICGTDLHIVDGEFPPTPYPIVPGHEFAGEVVALGSGVEGIASGARVGVDPSLFCGACAQCRRGRGNLCANWGAVGDTVDGAFAEYVAVPAGSLYRIPDSVTMREAALIEPLSCAVHGFHVLDPSAGDSILIVGAGTMGLLLTGLAARSAAPDLTVVDTRADRLPRAQGLGAARTASSVAAALEARPGGFDHVVDATGVPAAIEEGLGAVRRGGTFLIFGVAPEEARVPLSPFRIYNDEVTIRGSMAVLHSYGQALELTASRVIDPAPLLTEALPLDEFPSALDKVRTGGGLKTQVLPRGA